MQQRLCTALLCLLLLSVSAFAGTVPIGEAYNVAPFSSDADSFVRVGSKVFFTAFTPQNGRELWVTDGTAAGTVMLKDLQSGVNYYSAISGMTEFKGLLYFVVSGTQLWRSDGTAGGTYLVTTLPVTSSVVQLINAGSSMYILMSGYDVWTTATLWVTDGTAARTMRIRSFWRPVTDAFGHNGKLYFASSEDSLLGTQIWTSDGTLFGTRVLAPGVMCPMSTYGCSNGADFYRLNSKLMIVARSYEYDGVADLWTTDGTVAGTTLVKLDIGTPMGAPPDDATVAFFRRYNELWKSDGTIAGTALVRTFGAIETNHSVYAGASDVWFRATDTSSSYSYNYDHWHSDGTSAGTAKYLTGEAGVGGLYPIGTKLYLNRSDGTNGAEPWLSSGTAATTTMIKDIVSGLGSSTPARFFDAGSYVLFTAYTVLDGRELWRTDGTAAGTYLIKNIAPEAPTGEITGIVREAGTNTPLSGVEVGIYSRSGTLLTTRTTAADGTYRIDKLTTDMYLLRAQSNAHVPQIYPTRNCVGCSITTGSLVSVTARYTTTDVNFVLERGTRFSGTVKNTQGTVLENATVRVLDNLKRVLATAQSAADGTYLTAPALPNGEYWLEVLPPLNSGLAGAVHGGPACYNIYYYDSVCDPLRGTPITVSTPSTQTVHFSLPSAPRISGTVRDTDGRPVPHATVQIHNYYGAVTNTTTNAIGEFATSPLAPGNYFAVAQGTGFATQLFYNQNCAPNCDVSGGRAIQVDLDTNATGVDFALTSITARIRITVKDPNGQPLQLPVSIHTAESPWTSSYMPFSTNADGMYEFTNLTAGTYYLRIADQLYDGIRCAESCDARNGTAIQVPTATSIVTLNITYRKTPKISGRVTAAATGKPIAVWAVYVHFKNASTGAVLSTTQPNENGDWSMLEPLVPAYVQVNAPGYVPEVHDGKLLTCTDCSTAAPAGATIFDPATITADRTGINFALTARPTIRGTVSMQDGAPLNSSVQIYFYNSSGTVVGNVYTSGGEYYWQPTTAGTYYAAITDSWYSEPQIYSGIACAAQCQPTTGTPITVGYGATVSGINFSLRRKSGSISGTVVDAITGKPVAGVQVMATAVNAYDQSAAALTDSLGRYRIIAPTAASYYVQASKVGSEYLSRVYGAGACFYPEECDKTLGTQVLVEAGREHAGIHINLPRLSIDSITPARGPLGGGNTVTFNGANYRPGGTTVTFDGFKATVISSTGTQLVVKAPMGAVGYAHIQLTAGSVTATYPEAYVYVTQGSYGDMNGDYRSDVVWRSATTGAVEIWKMDGLSAPIAGAQPTVTDTNWEIKTTGDFNGDGAADIFWRNKVTGSNFIWIMQNGVRTQYSVGGIADLNWEVIGSGDFDLDGRFDIFWRNKSTGATLMWFSNGTSFRSAATASNTTAWKAEAIADINGDGRADLLWRNTSTGQVTAWLMNGNIATARSIGTMSDLNSRIAGANDVDADGLADIFWRNDSTGANLLWLNTGATFSARSISAMTYQFLGMGDFNADGRADILWRNPASGQVYAWLMNGGLLSSSVPLPVKGADWYVTTQH